MTTSPLVLPKGETVYTLPIKSKKENTITFVVLPIFTAVGIAFVAGVFLTMRQYPQWKSKLKPIGIGSGVGVGIFAAIIAIRYTSDPTLDSYTSSLQSDPLRHESRCRSKESMMLRVFHAFSYYNRSYPSIDHSLLIQTIEDDHNLPDSDLSEETKVDFLKTSQIPLCYPFQKRGNTQLYLFPTTERQDNKLHNDYGHIASHGSKEPLFSQLLKAMPQVAIALNQLKSSTPALIQKAALFFKYKNENGFEGDILKESPITDISLGVIPLKRLDKKEREQFFKDQKNAKDLFSKLKNTMIGHIENQEKHMLSKDQLTIHCGNLDFDLFGYDPDFIALSLMFLSKRLDVDVALYQMSQKQQNLLKPTFDKMTDLSKETDISKIIEELCKTAQTYKITALLP